MYNLRAYETEQSLLKIINGSGLNLVTLKLIVDKLNSNLNDALIQQIEKEAQERQQQLEEITNNEENNLNN